MRFSVVSSLFALSSLFVGSLAAPTTHQVRDVAIAEIEHRDVAVAAPVEERTIPKIIVIVDALYTEVFSYTKSINITISSCSGASISIEKKVKIVAEIQVVIQKIIAAFSACVIKLWALDVVALAEADFKLLVGLAIKIFLEIFYTTVHAAQVLKITIIELFGATLAIFLHAYFSFLLAVGKLVAGFIASVKIDFQFHIVVIGKFFVSFGPLLKAC